MITVFVHALSSTSTFLLAIHAACDSPDRASAHYVSDEISHLGDATTIPRSGDIGTIMWPVQAFRVVAAMIGMVRISCVPRPGTLSISIRPPI